jgi:hypothetical protein
LHRNGTPPCRRANDRSAAKRRKNAAHGMDAERAYEEILERGVVAM